MVVCFCKIFATPLNGLITCLEPCQPGGREPEMGEQMNPILVLKVGRRKLAAAGFYRIEGIISDNLTTTIHSSEERLFLEDFS